MGVNRRPKSGLKSGSIKGSAETRNDLPLDDFLTDHNQQPISGKLIGTRQKAKLDLVDWTKSNGYYTFHQALNSKSGPIANIGGKEYKVLSSYDYLGLIGHPKIDKAAIDAINKFGTSSGGVRLLTGTNVLHIELELKLAQFKGTDAALTFSSGYNANLAVLSSLLDTKDLALVDSRIHQSTIDACKLAGVPHRRFEHNNPRSLESLLKL
ncbi:MAG: aminotransferase class I/II-fold pyridoxal phosphate-dependent enzyme [Bacteroidia bacterium]|nr:aminotransferase class I/II-fold pyridoxal phosphate-dependent enzyme [Bacteroidia bacterium]